MILVILLIVPIMFWLIPFAQMQQNERNELRRFVINFGSMVLTCAAVAGILWYLNMEWTTLLVVLLAISAAWAVIFYLLTRGGRGGE